MKICHTLNPAQRLAVELASCTTRLPLLILAGPGTGKTNTLAHVAVNLMKRRHVRPERILMLTFTRLAAGEMKARIGQLLQPTSPSGGRVAKDQFSWVGTFHSIGHQLLKIYGDRVGVNRESQIASKSESISRMDLVIGSGPSHRVKLANLSGEKCLEIYSWWSNSKLSLAAALTRFDPALVPIAEELEKVFASYADAKKQENVFDFDDLLLHWDRLLMRKTLAHKISNCFDAVLIDEYQDTNPLQESIIRRLKPDGAGVVAVGDDAQAIYGWRGADAGNIRDFTSLFTTPAKVVELNLNYRSTKAIVDASNAAINLSQSTMKKNLKSENANGTKPRLVTVANEADQASFVADEVASHIRRHKSGSDICLLYRTDRHSRALQSELARRGIKFDVRGGSSFIERPDIKNLLAILKWAVNPSDVVSGRRAFTLLRGIGDVTATGLLNSMVTAKRPISQFEAFVPPASAKSCWSAFVSLMRRLRGGKLNWPDELDVVCEWYREIILCAEGNLEIQQLLAVAATFGTRQEFLTAMSIETPIATNQRSRVTLSTIHSSKGREWHSVIVLNVVESCLPYSRARRHHEIEEERRLLYVAMTRAKQKLTLMVPRRLNTGKVVSAALSSKTMRRSSFLPKSILSHFERQALVENIAARTAHVRPHQFFDLPGGMA
jgi:DNA helicase II / ATP-dependent DNA helicase PcrA